MVRIVNFIVMASNFRKGEIVRHTAAVKIGVVHKLLH
jgi:hypothetical protein